MNCEEAFYKIEHQCVALGIQLFGFARGKGKLPR